MSKDGRFSEVEVKQGQNPVEEVIDVFADLQGGLPKVLSALGEEVEDLEDEVVFLENKRLADVDDTMLGNIAALRRKKADLEQRRLEAQKRLLQEAAIKSFLVAHAIASSRDGVAPEMKQLTTRLERRVLALPDPNQVAKFQEAEKMIKKAQEAGKETEAEMAKLRQIKENLEKAQAELEKDKLEFEAEKAKDTEKMKKWEEDIKEREAKLSS